MKVLLGRDAPPRRRWELRLLFEPRDVWVGVYWNRARVWDNDRLEERYYLFVYVCVLPLFPVCLLVRRAEVRVDGEGVA